MRVKTSENINYYLFPRDDVKEVSFILIPNLHRVLMKFT